MVRRLPCCCGFAVAGLADLAVVAAIVAYVVSGRVLRRLSP